MSTRISDRRAFHAGLAASALLLAACHDGKLIDKAARAQEARAHAALANAEGAIACALPGERDFAPVCAIDRTATQDGLYLTLRQPDGGFRRLLVTRDGRGVIAADGAEPAVVTPVSADRIEVAIAGARYRLPATVRNWKPE